MTQSLTERLEFHATWLRDRRLTRQANLIDEALERLIELEELALTSFVGSKTASEMVGELPEMGSPYPDCQDETGENDAAEQD